jgi:hypothetical protein
MEELRLQVEWLTNELAAQRRKLDGLAVLLSTAAELLKAVENETPWSDPTSALPPLRKPSDRRHTV